MAAPAARLRTNLSAPGLINTLRESFSAVPDSRRKGSVRHSMTDTLGAAFAMFHLKFGSMLEFDTEAHADPRLIHNLKSLYRQGTVPSDTSMREILDEVPPEALRPAFEALHRDLQRGKALEDFASIDGRYLLAIDGTGCFCSTKVSCPHCLVKKRSKGGGTEYSHQSVAAAIVHPDKKGQALMLAVEPITNADGATKNDCEREAVKRLLDYIGTAFPNRKFLITEDALAANGPHLEALAAHDMDFIVGVKPGNSSVFETEIMRRQSACELLEWQDTMAADGSTCGYRYTCAVPINASYRELLVNYLEWWEVDKNGRQKVFTWVTNLAITADNVIELARSARARWRVENEVFNVLKNQGYEFGRNYGHGKKNLSSTLAALTMLAFLVDQIQEQACRVFKQARKRRRTKKSLWEKMRSAMELFRIPDWETMMALMIDPDTVDLKPEPGAG